MKTQKSLERFWYEDQHRSRSRCNRVVTDTFSCRPLHELFITIHLYHHSDGGQFCAVIFKSSSKRVTTLKGFKYLTVDQSVKCLFECPTFIAWLSKYILLLHQSHITNFTTADIHKCNNNPVHVGHWLSVAALTSSTWSHSVHRLYVGVPTAAVESAQEVKGCAVCDVDVRQATLCTWRMRRCPTVSLKPLAAEHHGKWQNI